MNLQQLEYVLEIVRHRNHLSMAAQALHTSQPGVSRQIKQLEAELGFEIFLRTRNRIIGLTEPGTHVLEIAKRVLTDVSALQSLKEDMAAVNQGTLTIATTHTQANYVLPSVIRSFATRFPDVRISLKQGDPESICSLVDSGEADLAIGTESARSFPLISLPCFALERSVVAPIGHRILEDEALTLERIAEYPIITYDPRFSGRWKVLAAFTKMDLEPRILLSAIDADVCKTYVRLGMGVAILASVAFDPAHDTDLMARDAGYLFESSTTYIRLRPNTYLRPYMLEFIQLLAPSLTSAVVKDALHHGGTPTAGLIGS